MAEKMNEGQKKALEWLKSGEASPALVRQFLPLYKMMCAAPEIADNMPPDVVSALKDEHAASLEIKSAALEVVSRSSAKDSGRSITDQSLLTKLLLKNEDTGTVTLGSKDGIEKLARAQISGRLTLIEYNILRSILSYQFDNGVEQGGEITFTASQIYRKMRRGAGSGKVNKTQQDEIHGYMEQLERRIQIQLNEPASAWLGINEEQRKKYMRILQFDYDEGIINGQRTEYYYTVYNVGLLQKIAYKAGQLERIPQEVLAVKELKGDSWKPWTLSEKRIKLRTVLELFYFQLIRTPGYISNKKPYADIFADVEGIKSRADIQRAKSDIAVILDYWQSLRMLTSWNEYGSGRGIELHIKSGEA